MSTTVCKFGGSSLSDASMFRRVKDIVFSDDARRYIVLSAPGKRCSGDEKITDLLYSAFRAEGTQSQYIFSQICERYVKIRDEICPGFPIEDELDRIFPLLRTSSDFAASRGEYLCAKLFSAFSGADFVDSAELIRFYPDGSLDMQSTREHIRSRLSQHQRAVIPGFYGSMPDGCIKTFTRGGGDVSGAIIAASLDADLYENWTDVDGLFSADPRLVANARRNLCVSSSQMRKIAVSGAELLHPDSIGVLEGTGIDTLIKNTFSPQAIGTRISENCTAIVPCITGKRNLHAPVLKSLSAEPCVSENDGAYCMISIFGMDSSAMRRIHSQLSNICIFHMQDHYVLITQDSQYESAVKHIHSIMIG